MRDHEAAMRVYVQLAIISGQKKQSQVRDRFLLLAGTEACKAGWPDVAQRCHQKLVAANPAHQASRFPSFSDALRDEQFQRLVAKWERYCPYETAEAMLLSLELPTAPATEETIGEQMLRLLDQASGGREPPVSSE